MLDLDVDVVSFMLMRTGCILVALAPVLAMAACASQPMKTAEQTTRRGVNEAAHAPFEDFNLVRSRIPVALHRAEADPYARPDPLTCDSLAADLVSLDDALGPDFDTPKPARSRMDRGASFAANAGAKAMKDLTEGWIPMRNWVRYMTGAEQHSKDVQDAVSAGRARRAYLKGLAQSEGCPDIGPAQPAYLFPAPPRTPSSVARN